MKTRRCTNCGDPHNATSFLCARCYNYERKRGTPRPKNLTRSTYRRCGDPATCGERASEHREVAQVNADGTEISGVLWLCPGCAKLFDQIERPQSHPVMVYHSWVGGGRHGAVIA